jgi:hypothetical protein
VDVVTTTGPTPNGTMELDDLSVNTLTLPVDAQMEEALPQVTQGMPAAPPEYPVAPGADPTQPPMLLSQQESKASSPPKERTLQDPSPFLLRTPTNRVIPLDQAALLVIQNTEEVLMF